MMEPTYWSILPPVLAIVLAIITRQVIFSLLAGLLLGYSILQGGNIFLGFLDTMDGLIMVFQDAGNVRIVVFTLLIGSLLQIIRHVRGVDGFTHFISQRFENVHQPKKKLQLGAAITGFLIFIESNISILTVGTVFRPLFDKFNISREKLAYLVDSSSAPSCILIPFNAWGAYIMGLLATYDHIDALSAVVYAIPFNFYAILTLALVFITVIRGTELGAMRKSQGAPESYMHFQQAPGKAIDMILPIALMILSMPFFLYYTGWRVVGQAPLWHTIGNGSGSQAVLYAISVAILLSGVVFTIQKKIDLKSLFSESIIGMQSMMNMAILMTLAFALSNLCAELQTGPYVASVTSSWLEASLAPAVIFLTSCFIAFSTGTSWGTFAIMLSIAMPLSVSTDANPYLMIGAVLGGGIFGDHCSPISDTTLISSVAADCDHIQHVRTQLPYALITGGMSLIFYLIAGFIF
jgi:Na+/H+ antiporter NhaC